MKMTTEHFTILEAAMNKSMQEGAMLPFDTSEWTNMRFRWQWMHETKIDGQRSSAWVCDHLYPYLNDDHIDTALRRIAGHSF